MTSHRSRWWLAFVLSAFVSSGGAAHACSVPVFRYALERWPADPYEIIVFHRGALPEAAKKVLDRLDAAAHDKTAPANLDLVSVDLDDNPEPELKKLWEQQTDAQLPWMVVRYPRALRRDETVWATRVTEAAADALVRSPLRSKVAGLLLKGETGVWILLESGDKKKDEAAAALLEKELKRLSSALKLPELNKNDPDDRIAQGPNVPALKVSFALLRLARTDPAEQALVQMLLHAEEDLLGFRDQPLAFPIFGRGRAHFALVGGGIVASNIEESCTALVGPCTCQVKRFYPGTDLLISTDWDKVFKSADTNAARPAPATNATPALGTPSSKPVTPGNVQKTANGAETVAPEDGSTESGTDSSLLWLLGVLAVCVAGSVGVAFVFGRGMRDRS